MKRIPLCLLIISLLFYTALALSNARETQDEKTRMNRLVELCKLWGQIKVFHPSLAYRTDLDWDQALVDTLPKVRSAKTQSEYKAALQSMLEALNDPFTRIAPVSPVTADSGGNKGLDYRVTQDGILLVTIGDYFALTSPESQEKLREITAAVGNARAIVFDLRSETDIGDYGRAIFNIYFGQIERLINSETLKTEGMRRRVYYGYENHSSSASGQYKTGFLTENNSEIVPLNNAKNIPSVFVLNKDAAYLRSMTALQRSGKSLIVYEGKDLSAGDSTLWKLNDDLTAQIRVSEPVFEDGTDGSLQPDLFVSGEAVNEALKLASDFKPSSIVRKKLPAVSVSVRDKRYAEMKYPAIEYRLLAAFRIWNVINYFYPYKELLEKDWNDILGEHIPKFEKAQNELEYTLAVAEMVTEIHDSHAYINGPVYNEFVGTGYPPIRVRLIEKKPVVTALTDESIAASAGVRVGDVVLKVDGENAEVRLARYAKYISASTHQSKMDKATLSFMNGKPDSIVTLTVLDRDQKERTVRLKRKYEDFNTLYHRERNGEIVRLLPGNIGYADLDRLTLDMLDGMFEKFRNTKAIIFDMRGYPNGTAWAIAPRLSSGQENAALFETPLLGHNLPEGAGSARFFQRIRPAEPGKFLYEGQTVMLIDERAASQAEHTGLLLRAANGTKFVGSNTTGVNGEITTFSVPGGITIGFTGQSVKFPDGTQLQRIGLVPDVKAKPTIDGIRAGRDEVLERAVEYINE